MRFHDSTDFLAHVKEHGANFSGWLDLSDCTGLTKAIHNCGNLNRTIAAYNHKTKGRVISLGCFIGNESECIEAILNKYGNTPQAQDYIAKIKLAFTL